MINIDDRILSEANEAELYLLLWIAKYMGKENFAFPSNETICEKTGWDIKKLRRVKAACIEKGFFSSFRRYKDNGGETSAGYKIETGYISVFVNLKGRGEFTPPSQNRTTPPSQNRTTPPSQNGTTSILKEEVLKEEGETRPPEPKPQKEEKLVIAQEIENLIKANPQVSPAELKVFVLKEAIKRHFEKYPLNRDLYTTGLTPVPTAREFLEQIDIYVRHYSAESVPGYQFFVNDPVGHIPKTFPKWLRRWATGKRDELRRSGATDARYEKPKI